MKESINPEQQVPGEQPSLTEDDAKFFASIPGGFKILNLEDEGDVPGFLEKFDEAKKSNDRDWA